MRRLGSELRAQLECARNFGTAAERINAFMALNPTNTPGVSYVRELQKKIQYRIEYRIEHRIRRSDDGNRQRIAQRSQKRALRYAGRELKNEIRRRGGEISIDGERDIAYIQIVDHTIPDGAQKIRAKNHLYLLKAEGWRYYSRRFGARPASLAYVAGWDDSGAWAVRVPGTIENVADAVDWIEPAAVKAARARGKRVLRQGDVYAVETTKAHDGNGELPEGHSWDPQTRVLTHHEHAPMEIAFPCRFLRQKAFGMGRGAGFGSAD